MALDCIDHYCCDDDDNEENLWTNINADYDVYGDGNDSDWLTRHGELKDWSTNL